MEEKALIKSVSNYNLWKCCKRHVQVPESVETRSNHICTWRAGRGLLSLSRRLPEVKWELFPLPERLQGRLFLAVQDAGDLSFPAPQLDI